MGESKDTSNLKRLEKRLKAARQRRDDRGPGQDGRSSSGASTSGMAVGLRIAVEILAGLAVGVGIGLLLDHWLGTQPWMLILFFILGAGASMVNVMRTARELERRAEEERKRGSNTGPEQ
ncbi:MAG: AtpZ/AtpI family protein [Rhodovibrionaceae bacterium]|nr:AtpZ/AtpI family protein [Rhodovibrionaceae bacterium]